AADRDEHPDDRPEHEAGQRQPPVRLQPLPQRPQVDLLLGLGLDQAAHLSHEAATLAAAHSHWARTPCSSGVRGSQPRSRRIRVVSAFVRRWSPATGGRSRTSSGRPASRSNSAIASRIVTSTPPPTLYVPRPRSMARIVASTTSATYVKLRDWRPSP